MPSNRSRLVAALLAALPPIGASLPAAADSPWRDDRGHTAHPWPGRGLAPVPAAASWSGGSDRWRHGGPSMVPIQRGRHVG